MHDSRHVIHTAFTFIVHKYLFGSAYTSTILYRVNITHKDPKTRS